MNRDQQFVAPVAHARDPYLLDFALLPVVTYRWVSLLLVWNRLTVNVLGSIVKCTPSPSTPRSGVSAVKDRGSGLLPAGRACSNNEPPSTVSSLSPTPLG